MYYSLKTRTMRIVIDHSKCETCDSYDCAKACSLYGTNILRIKNGKPVTFFSDEDVARRDNECLSCEIHCPHSAVKIFVEFKELDEYLNRKGDFYVVSD
ncbi:hypothetical protein Asulf_00891 [Archaeoglobus sulfaticallidus PM70-1]|uniref:4Fe-4S ferredoxin-type domain-containing protein n=1 Tax=Archaeoglobus sulfaticallidus PM70-1 TaxID=387631 RepID=N0BD09_9EURY|nr:hypothetical protein [Archaeoglobus sulfaticallidus]AGK60898.1 hypothetical protein Asulf_00891 [Archaeoglobus sulfaticallidus PM70-1]